MKRLTLPIIALCILIFAACKKNNDVQPVKRTYFSFGVAGVANHNSPIVIVYTDSNLNTQTITATAYVYIGQYKPGIVSVTAFAKDSTAIIINFNNTPSTTIKWLSGTGKQTLNYTIS